MNPDFIRTVDFFTRESPTRNTEKKNIFRENPVEVRSFDGIYLFSYNIGTSPQAATNSTYN